MAESPEALRLQQQLDALRPRPFLLLGCVRRNVWTRRQPHSDAGNALLALLGTKQTVPWAGGLADVYVSRQGTVLVWFPGPWRDWWVEDLVLLAGMIRAETGLAVPAIVVCHELDGTTHLRYVEVPVHSAEQHYVELVGAWRQGGEEKPPRWNRRSPRAERICPRCPVRVRCESVDREHGETDDWQ